MGRDAALLGVSGLVAKPPGFRERCEASAVRAASAGSPPVGLLSAGSDAGALPSPPKLGNGEAVGRGDADGLALVPVLFGESLPRAGDFDRLKRPICRLSSLEKFAFEPSLPTYKREHWPNKSCQSYRASCPTVLLLHRRERPASRALTGRHKRRPSERWQEKENTGRRAGGGRASSREERAGRERESNRKYRSMSRAELRALGALPASAVGEGRAMRERKSVESRASDDNGDMR